ncbi:MAG: arylsulfatase [Novosphingobium sp.]|nr:arylsulfatase [Novosphingobium sp.]
MDSGVRHKRIAGKTSLALALAMFASGPLVAQATLPPPSAPSNAKVGRTAAESSPSQWPQGPQAPKGAPNILLIMTDDVGFGASSAFGGPIPTPTFDRLAASGARYNRFNTTAICSPTRAALLTGREPHNTGMGNVANLPTGYEGYTSVISRSTGMVAETLRQNGYSTSVFGKWHLTPEWEQSSVGPFDRWPAGQGFEYFYGFQGGDTDQYAPALYENTRAISPPDEPDYILDQDLAARASKWIQQQHDLAPSKPFFMYYAPGTAHSPHSAPREWIEKFRGKFDQGWDVQREQIFARQKKLKIIPQDVKLTPRPASLPAWSSLPTDQKRLYSRMMEVYAAALSFADTQIGTVIDQLRASGQLDNTLIVYIQGDNGASAEGREGGLLIEDSMINGYREDEAELLSHIDDLGGPRALNHYPAGWAWSLNSPFQYYKQVASHFGGVRNGMVAVWSGRIKPGAVRSQFLYVTDVVPTLLEAAGIEQPTSVNGVAQKPLDGASFTYTFREPTATQPPRTQVFEMMQNLGIYKDGWWAGTRPVAAPWEVTLGRRSDLASRHWELYNVGKDFSQSTDVASVMPDKLSEMKDAFFKEAEANLVLPIHSVAEGAEGRPSIVAGRSDFTFHAGLTRVGESAAPRLIGRSWTIAAKVDVPQGGANGILMTQGGRFGGWAFYLNNGRPVFHYNAIGRAHQYQVRADSSLPPGSHEVVAEFAADGPKPGAAGTLTLKVDGKQVARGRIERTHVTWISQSETMDVGEDTLTPVNDEYTIKNSRFTGTLKEVKVHLK